MPNTPLHILAPAKVNLFLHITGKRQDGYHLLQSLIGFTEWGDDITISPSTEFKFTQESEHFKLPEADDNLVVRAAKGIASLVEKPLHCHLHLKKNIPIGAGLGGGSSDAAATIRGLLKFWGVHAPREDLQGLLLSLGADVPVCYHNKSCFVGGVGENIRAISGFEAQQAVLVFPNHHVATPDIFKNYKAPFSKKINPLAKAENFLHYVKTHKNDLTNAATHLCPDIFDVISTLELSKGCDVARMSGSGSACFGLFMDETMAIQAAEAIQKERPNWWVRPVVIR